MRDDLPTLGCPEDWEREPMIILIIIITIKFLYSATHNNRINALYISALVIGPITSLYKVSQLPWATVYIAPKAFSFTSTSVSKLSREAFYYHNLQTV